MSLDYGIIDTDTHVVEPYDLWTSRMPKKYGDKIPHVRHDKESGYDYWYINGTRGIPAAAAAQAGYDEYAPAHPKTLGDAQRYTWDAKERLALMDSYGIEAGVLFPNVIFFDQKSLSASGEADFVLDALRAYNDWQIDWGSIAPNRFLAQTMVPFWDLDEAIAEVTRCKRMGHRGVVMTSDTHYFGLPKLTDRHWDPLWAALQEMGLPVNFHIGSADNTAIAEVMADGVQGNAAYSAQGVLQYTSNIFAITQVIAGGICQRFPKLNFVSVESGVGWLPFALHSMDWQWRNCGVQKAHPELELLPSEYFKRQVYGCFWFEREDTLVPAINVLGADNIMYETDFPHPTSMSPGPGSGAQSPTDYITEIFADISPVVKKKILHDNAARIYGLI